jgi:hypothetical protein
VTASRQIAGTAEGIGNATDPHSRTPLCVPRTGWAEGGPSRWGDSQGGGLAEFDRVAEKGGPARFDWEMPRKGGPLHTARGP